MSQATKQTAARAVSALRAGEVEATVVPADDLPVEAQTRRRLTEQLREVWARILTMSSRTGTAGRHRRPVRTHGRGGGDQRPHRRRRGCAPDLPADPGLPDVPYDLATLKILAPYALAMALVGLMESLVAARLVDDITDTHSNKIRESSGQGIATLSPACSAAWAAAP